MENAAPRLQLAPFRRKRNDLFWQRWIGCSGQVCPESGTVGVPRCLTYSLTPSLVASRTVPQILGAVVQTAVP